jgi:hypothetical protein
MIPDTSGTGSENVLNIPGLLERLQVESQTWRGYKTSDQIRALFMAAVPRTLKQISPSQTPFPAYPTSEIQVFLLR